MQSGSEQLLEWMERKGFDTRTQAAKFLGVDKSIVTKLAKGTRKPGRESAIRLQRQTGIPIEAWSSDASDTSEKRGARKPRKRR